MDRSFSSTGSVRAARCVLASHSGLRDLAALNVINPSRIGEPAAIG